MSGTQLLKVAASPETRQRHAALEFRRANRQGGHILVAAGRVPNTAGIGLDTAGVELPSAALSA